MDEPANISSEPAWTGHAPEDFALVLEGGGMRGQFTAGVLDFLMERGLFARRVTGTSAGALTGLNYVAGAIGRTIFLNAKYCTDWRYLSMRNFARTGNALGAELMFHTIPEQLEPFNNDDFRLSPTKLESVASCLETGDANYHEHSTLDERDLLYLQASCSMPLVTKIVEVDGKHLLDGGVCDSVPWMRSLLTTGLKKQVVVLTRDAGYVKEPQKLMALARARYGDWPLFLERMAQRHFEYNLCYRRLARMHEEGSIFVIQPTEPVEVGQLENDPEKLIELYGRGYRRATETWEDLQRYLEL